MSYTAELTDGVTTYDFIYDAASQANYSLRKGLRAVMEDTQVLQHIPDNGTPVPVWGNDRPRTIFLTKDVRGDTVDEVLNKIIDIKRMIDGADQQALRYWTDGDVNRVDFKIQRENATNHTLNPVRWGWVDDSGAHYNAAAVKNGFAIGILVVLHVSPYGEGATITLRNDLPSSPHFIEDSSGNGLADGWNQQGTPMTSIAKTKSLIGGQSQRVETDSSTTEGISSDNIAASSGVDVVAYAWVFVQSGDDVTVQVRNGAGTVLEAKTVTTAGGSDYDKTAVGEGGDTWYRVSFSTTTTNTNGVLLYIIRASGDASATTVFFVDGCYVELSQDTVPSAWCSTSAIENRYDVTSGNESRINYFDVWGIPGDSDALVDLSVDATSGTNTINIISRITGNNIHDILYWRESDQYTSLVGSWSTSTGTSDNHFFQLASGSATGQIGNSEDWQYLVKQSLRVFVIGRSSSTTPTVEVKIYGASPLLSGSEIASTDAVSVNAANTWELLDLGLLNLTEYADGTSDLYEVVDVADAGSATVDIDAVIFLPIRDEFMMVEIDDLSGAASSTKDYTTNGGKKQVRGFDGFLKQQKGSIWYAKPTKENRYIFFMIEDDAENTLATAVTITLIVTPRTRHLLGTT